MDNIKKADAKNIEKILKELSDFTSVEGEITRQTFSSAWLSASEYIKSLIGASQLYICFYF